MDDLVYELFNKAHISPMVLVDRKKRIKVIRDGLPSETVTVAAEYLGSEMLLHLLGVGQDTLQGYLTAKRLNRSASEQVLDVICLYAATVQIWGNKESAIDWLNSPIAALAGEKPLDISDTFEGRRWVREILEKIKTGDFS